MKRRRVSSKAGTGNSCSLQQNDKYRDIAVLYTFFVLLVMPDSIRLQTGLSNLRTSNPVAEIQ